MIRKFIIFFIFFTFSVIPVKAQLDLEHWFPPFHIPKSYKPIPETAELYISTPQEEYFKIRIYGGKSFLLETTISRDKPLKFSVPFEHIFLSANLAMKVVDGGIYVAGEKSFFADMRISFSTNYTEIITSKGKSALGKDFKNANPPISLYEGFQTTNMQTSIMAYHDNTKIKIFGYSNKISFSDKSTPKFLEFTLNRGETFAASILKRDNYDLYDNDYINTFVGASIISYKPIVINNGGINGTGSYEGGNIMYDQNLPIKNLGTEYYFQKGKSDLKKGIEKALVIATQDNTKIFLNGDAQPISTINKGEHFLVQSKNFVNNGIHIKTSLPAYVYQIMSGSNKFQDKVDYSFLSYGYALVPPLDKNKSSTINYLQDLDKIGQQNFETDVLIFAEKNKNTQLNDANISSSFGPFNILGNDFLEYYLIKDFTGDAKISSNGNLVTGAISGLPTFAGHAGYFTSFSNDPFITKNGNCIQETVILSVSNIDFEKIQWQRNGVDIAGANSPYFTPTLAGTYRCKLTYGYENFNFLTNEIVVNDCPYSITETQVNNICAGKELFISPEFSPPNTKFEVKKVEILTPPLEGTVKIVGTDLQINISESFSGANRVVYKITSDTGFYEIITAKFTVYENPNFALISPIDPIGIDKNKFIYNLNQSTALNSDTNLNFKFYKTSTINSTNEITNPSNFITIQKNAFVKITNANNCSKILEIKLNQPKLPPTDEPDTSEFINTFTPNNDGYNDVWSFESLENYQDLMVNIFDKNGVKVYEYSVGKPFYWNGKNNANQKLPSGTYWVVLKGINPEKNEILNKSMWIYLKNR